MKNIEAKDIVFIINAGSGSRMVAGILNELREYSPGSTFIVTQSEKELDEIFLVQENSSKVYVAVGGDGTVRKVVEHLIGTNHLLGIVPTGSGNGFARQLGISNNIKEAVRNLIDGEPTSIDILNVNGRLGISMVGLGFDAEVAYRFSRLGVRGLIGYVLSSFQALWCFNLFYANISNQFIREDGVFWMVDIVNSGQYGNNARIAPQSLYDDGKMDIVIVKPIPVHRLPVFLFQLFTGRLSSSTYIKYIRTGGPVSITYTGTRFHIDGDTVEIKGESLDVKLLPRVIQVITPVKPV